MKVRRNEGVAIHIGPKPCAGIREDVGEASAGECIGQPLSRESEISQDADAVSVAEGNTGPWHVRKLLVREPGDLQFDHSHDGVVRIGKARSRSR